MDDTVEENEKTSEVVKTEVKSKETDLEDLAKVEITKATISQAFGTLLFPITSELAAAQVRGINRLKAHLKDRSKFKLANKNRKKLNDIAEKAKQNPNTNWPCI